MGNLGNTRLEVSMSVRIFSSNVEIITLIFNLMKWAIMNIEYLVGIGYPSTFITFPSVIFAVIPYV